SATRFGAACSNRRARADVMTARLGTREQPTGAPDSSKPLSYQTGFANDFATEALPGTLPARGNSPQRPAYGLYTEQISGTAFTAPRPATRRSWLSRIRPAVVHGRFARIDNGLLTNQFGDTEPSPNQLRWNPLPIPTQPTDFVQGLLSIGGNGSPA